MRQNPFQKPPDFTMKSKKINLPQQEKPMYHSSQKIYQTREDLASTLALWQFKGYSVVFTNGCFDLLHLGHVDYLEKAAALGDKLVLGLNTDTSVSRLKGPSRPLQSEESRARVLAALEFVDVVIPFDEDTPKELIEFVKPDVLVKGADYKEEDIVGGQFVKANGGRVERIQFVDGYSSTAIINKIKEED